MSLDARWKVYGFTRDGISYYQINDLAGRVQIIVGRADDAFWALPSGETAFRVSLPSQRLPLPERVVPSVIYRGPDFSIVHYAGGDALWSVEVSGASP